MFKRKAEGDVGTVPVASAALLDGLDQFHNSMNGIVQVAFFHGLYELTPVFVGIRAVSYTQLDGYKRQAHGI